MSCYDLDRLLFCLVGGLLADLGLCLAGIEVHVTWVEFGMGWFLRVVLLFDLLIVSLLGCVRGKYLFSVKV